MEAHVPDPSPGDCILIPDIGGCSEINREVTAVDYLCDEKLLMALKLKITVPCLIEVG